jgi:hypothetical protein
MSSELAAAVKSVILLVVPLTNVVEVPFVTSVAVELPVTVKVEAEGSTVNWPVAQPVPAGSLYE